jgi:hypothetical protein
VAFLKAGRQAIRELDAQRRPILAVSLCISLWDSMSIVRLLPVFDLLISVTPPDRCTERK